MYGHNTTTVAALPATGAAFGFSDSLGMVVAALALIFLGLVLTKLAPARRK